METKANIKKKQTPEKKKRVACMCGSECVYGGGR
jgi:hypothetical protein